VVSREHLFKLLRGVEYDGQDRSMDVAISRLRRKLGDDSGDPHRIKTVRHRGYLFAPNAWDQPWMPKCTSLASCLPPY